MKRILVPLCLIIGFAMLAYNLYFWGGLASTHEVGSMVREHASTFSFITWSYVTAGEGILNMLGWNEGAAQFANSEVGNVFATMQGSPSTALDELFKAMPGFSLFCYYGAPLLILIGTFAQSRKPKSFKTFGTK